MPEYDYKPNSHKYKERQKEAANEEKRVQKVVSGNVKTKKKSDVHKLADVFFSEDISNVKSYIIGDVLIPAFKKTIVDMITNGTDMLVYGESRSRKRRSDSDYVSYRSYSDRRDDRREPRARSRFDYEDLVFESRGAAEAVRDEMQDALEDYGVVIVADMYDAAGLTAPYTANSFGWTSIRNSEVVRVRDGYVIRLPRPMAID